MAKGILIALEGLDGCGKTSQIKLLTAYLQDQGREVICTREPGGTRLGENLRQILLQEDNLNWSGQSEALVFFSSRVQLLQEVILPALHKGQIVLSAR
ncbi:MAG: dTMP kinase, partial [Clostridia bacterium]|nr:dTMP kinase [Clostridia bacterium]